MKRGMAGGSFAERKNPEHEKKPEVEKSRKKRAKDITGKRKKRQGKNADCKSSTYNKGRKKI